MLGPQIQPQRVDAGDDVAQRLVHGTVAGDAGHVSQIRAAEFYEEMALPACGGTGVTGVGGAVVDHLDLADGEGSAQGLLYLVAYRHFLAKPPSLFRLQV